MLFLPRFRGVFRCHKFRTWTTLLFPSKPLAPSSFWATDEGDEDEGGGGSEAQETREEKRRLRKRIARSAGQVLKVV